MKNKKGFTLVELLAVIAILAILVLLALPNVLKQFGNAKKSAFETEVKELITQAESDFISDTMFNTTSKTYNSESNPLSLSGNDLEYDINMDTKGNITCLQVSNGSYQFTYSGDGITKTDEVNALDKEEDFVPKCEEKTIAYAPEGCFNIDYDGTITFYQPYYYDEVEDTSKACPLEVNIPKTIDGITVTKIGNNAFTYYGNCAGGFTKTNSYNINYSIDKLNSNKDYNVTKIGCSGPRAVKKVIIPNTVKSIGNYVFIYDENLEEIIFEDGSQLESIGKSAFQNTGLTSITIPASVTSIGESAFYETTLLGEVIIEENSNLTEIGKTAFYKSGLRKINLEDTKIKKINYETFYYTNIYSLTFPETIESIDDMLFYTTPMLNSLIFPDSKQSNITALLESIGDYYQDGEVRAYYKNETVNKNDGFNFYKLNIYFYSNKPSSIFNLNNYFSKTDEYYILKLNKKDNYKFYPLYALSDGSGVELDNEMNINDTITLATTISNKQVLGIVVKDTNDNIVHITYFVNPEDIE